MSYTDNIPLFNLYSVFVGAFHSTICYRIENKKEQCFICDPCLFNLLMFYALLKNHSLVWLFFFFIHNTRILTHRPLEKTSKFHLLYYISKLKGWYKIHCEYLLTRSWKKGVMLDIFHTLQPYYRPILDLVFSIFKVSWQRAV